MLDPIYTINRRAVSTVPKDRALCAKTITSPHRLADHLNPLQCIQSAAAHQPITFFETQTMAKWWGGTHYTANIVLIGGLCVRCPKQECLQFPKLEEQLCFAA